MYSIKWVSSVVLTSACLSCIQEVSTRNIQLDAVKVDEEHVQKYAALKQILVSDLGYTQEFADNVEINLKRAIREEKERQKLLGTVPNRLRQGQQGVSEEDDDDDESTTIGITTPGPGPGDIVKGIAQIIQGVGTFNVGTFWNSFVNFFPPGQREGAQALVDASQGRRPDKWPTIPTTTTKLTTTTKDEDEIDSEETTQAATAAPAAVATTQQAAAQAATVAGAAVPAATAAPVSVSAPEAATRAPVARYTIRPRTAAPVAAVLRNSVSILDEFPGPSSLSPSVSSSSTPSSL